MTKIHCDDCSFETWYMIEYLNHVSVCGKPVKKKKPAKKKKVQKAKRKKK